MMKLLTRCSRIVALGLGLSVLQVYAIPAGQLVNGVNSVIPQGQALLGRLKTAGNKPVLVNGATARSGDTIFSGQSIQTSDVGANVSIPGIGLVDIAPNSNLTITFSQGKITLSVASGCVILK